MKCSVIHINIDENEAKTIRREFLILHEIISSGNCEMKIAFEIDLDVNI